MDIGRSFTNQYHFSIIASSLITLLVLIAVVPNSGGQYLGLTAYETDIAIDSIVSTNDSGHF